ncbi:MAG: hypothetical protein MJZ34_14595 [Paludibacteraceae bacterium]|nr:hypothetical protein [Paludibacteraceae bacterium]
MKRKFKVHLIGSGFESVKWYFVYSSSPLKAIEDAEAIAKADGLIFGTDYLEILVDEYIW